MGTSCGHNVLWRPSCKWAYPHSSTSGSISAHSPATSGTHVSGSSTLLRPGKLRGRRLCNFFFLLIFSTQENKSEGALEVVTVFSSASYPFHTTINNRLCSSQSGQGAVPAVVDKVSSTDLQVSHDWQWQWRECFFDVYVELYYSQACFPHNLWAIISNGILSLGLDFYSPVSCSSQPVCSSFIHHSTWLSVVQLHP